MHMDNKVYDILKWIAQFLLPGLGTLYFAIASIWGLPYVEEVVGTLMAIDVFLGAILGISAMEYQKTRQLEGDFTMAASGSDFVDAGPSSPLQLSADTYDRIKWFSLTVLPAGGALYLALSKLWAFPYGTEVVGTIAAITAFLGVMLGVSSAKLKKSLLNK